MFRMLVDTCVWLDVARDRKQIALLGVVEQMIRRRLLSLIVPRLLLDEFRRNRARIEKDSAKSLASQLKIVKDAVKKEGTPCHRCEYSEAMGMRKSAGIRPTRSRSRRRGRHSSA